MVNDSDMAQTLLLNVEFFQFAASHVSRSDTTQGNNIISLGVLLSCIVS